MFVIIEIFNTCFERNNKIFNKKEDIAI